MNRVLFRQTWRAQRLKLMVVSAALAFWGFLMPVIYARFGSQFRAIISRLLGHGHRGRAAKWHARSRSRPAHRAADVLPDSARAAAWALMVFPRRDLAAPS
jgi:hypothetical protein